MGHLWYLSPSCQTGNLGVDGYGSEQEQMYLLAAEIIPYLDRAGVRYRLADASVPISRRCQESNAMGADFHLALHSNAGGSGTARGPVGLYYSEAGKALCGKLVHALLALGQETNRCNTLVAMPKLYELRKTKAVAALLEVDFHDSPGGVAFLTGRRSEIGKAIAGVILEVEGLSEKEEGWWDAATRLGIVDAGTQPDAAATQEDLAKLGMRILNYREK